MEPDRGAGPFAAARGLPAAEIGVFLLAWAVRFAHLLQIRNNPFFTRPIIDAKMFDELAVRIAAGGLPGVEAFTHAPLYPLFLGGLYRLLGHDYFLARLVQVTLGAVNCALLVAIGRRAFGTRAGVLAGLTAALYGTLVFYDAELLRPVLVIFLSLCAVAALLGAAARPSRLRWGGAGLLLGLAAIAWEATLLFVPAALLWLWRTLRGRLGAREIAVHGACLCLAVAAAILPVTLHNYRVSGDLVLVSAWGGVNFYLGNGPAAGTSVAIQPGKAWDDLVALPERRAGLSRPSERSRWFYRETFAFIRERPLAWAGLLGRKLALFWDAAEFEPNNDLAYFRERSALFRLLHLPAWPVVVPFGVVGPLALVGLALLSGKGAPARLLLLFALALLLALVLYHVRARYRLVAVPLLILFAAGAVDRLIAGFRGAWGRRERVAALAALSVAVLFVNAGFFANRTTAAFPLHTTLGKIHVESGRFAEARREFLAAVAADPADADALVNLGVIAEREGDGEEALARFSQALRAQPGYAVAHNNLGVWYAARGRGEEAIAALRTAVRLEPDYAAAWGNLGAAYAERGLRELAGQALAEAARLRAREGAAR